MNQPAQDIDSGTGQVVTKGQPVDHIDMEDGASVGHNIEPAADPEAHVPGMTVTDKPPGMSRDEIYGKAKDVRDATAEADLAGMNPADRAAYQRMIAEAQGVAIETDDPYDGDGAVKEGWIDPNDPNAPAIIPAPQPVVAQPAPGQPAAQYVDPALDTEGQMTTIVVYGEKRDVPTAEINEAGGIANYQKNVAADERMARLSTYEASLRALDGQLQNQRATQVVQPQATALPTAAPEPSPTDAQDETVDVQAQAEKLVGAMYTGDREAAITQAAEVLAGIQTSAKRAAQTNVVPAVAPGISAEEQRVAYERAQRQATERAEANHVFVDEFSDLDAPVLRQATYAMVQEVAAEPIMYGRPLAEVTREAGLRVRKQVYGDSPAVAPVVPIAPSTVNVPQPAPQTLTDRMALKSRTVVQPLIPAQGRFVDPASAEPKTESNSDYIARMKAARGQQI